MVADFAWPQAYGLESVLSFRLENRMESAATPTLMTQTAKQDKSSSINKIRILLLLGIVILILLFYLLDLGHYFNLDYLKNARAQIQSFRSSHPFESAGLFMLIYIAVTGLSLPAAGIMTLTGGAVFGLLWGTCLSSISAVIGATIAFLASRFLFRDFIQSHFKNKLGAVNRGIEQDGASYLFTLRLVPIFPFFIINVVMALTPIRTLTFFLVSLVGMLPATIVFVNAGTQLARIQSVADILSFKLLASFALLGLFPLITKKLVHFIRGLLHKPEALPGEDEVP
jgi:uncharacterized membrane protein YdjX (TVP38/TMEM64 family)